MTQINFGVGTLIARRTDTTNMTPIQLGIVQDCSIDLDQTNVELFGQYKDPFDVAPGKRKITGKAKFARLQVESINNLILDATQTSASGFDMASAEAASGSATTFTVTNGSSFVQDLGVFYSSSGIALTLTTATPTVGFYVPGVAGTGTYTRAAADATVALSVYYTFTVTSLVQGVASSVLMGSGPIFEVYLANTYKFNGVAKKFNLKLNACRASRLNFPFSNMNYAISDFDFQAFMDASGVIGTWALTE